MKTQAKTLLAIAASLAFAAGVATPLLASAQGAQQAPAGFKVILNNDRVRVFESTFAPGVTVPIADYPRRTVYVLKGQSQFAYTHADGKSETLTQQAGTVSSRERERMSVTNTGANEVVVLVVIDKRDLPQAQ